DHDFLKKLLENFISSNRETNGTLQHALESNDTEKLLYVIHKLKGSAGNIAAKTLFNLATKLETDLRGGKYDTLNNDIAQLRLHLDDVIQACKALCDSPLDEPMTEGGRHEASTTTSTSTDQANTLEEARSLATTLIQQLEQRDLQSDQTFERLKHSIDNAMIDGINVKALEHHLDQLNVSDAMKELQGLITRLSQ
ncbi:MAG: Hpt domain-containing protein, partial [Magnetococcales bacterium]|nr:Hpt domain-containing protein [Magnetococcales bacterium]